MEADLRSVPTIRHTVAGVMAGWGWEGGSLEAVLLVCSELVANAVVHAALPGDKVTVRVRESDGDCRIEVVDRRPDLLPAACSAGETEEWGRGLLLVRACAEDMAVVTSRRQKLVWARVLREAAA